MKFYQESTVWSINVQNHIYYLSDDKRKMVGYIPQGKKDLVKFSTPIGFEAKGRKLILLSMPAESDDVYFSTISKEVVSEGIEVEGSNGKKYFLKKNKNKWTCTCPGFQFRNKCKHVDNI